ncbi:MAG: hypothetical protein KGV51_08245 [Moraxellaceae bacterium]|nr:hypothetical protein [Moraxellaceae bacterium]
MTHNTQTLMLNIKQVDSWFFREARPHGSAGANALSSVFPPPTRTLMGALRSHIGNSYFVKNSNKSWDDLEVTNVIGDADNLGSLQPRGVFLQKNEQTYFPAPVNICYKVDETADEEDKPKYYFAMQLSDNHYQTDVGNLYLPQLPITVKGLDDVKGAKPLEKSWLSKTAWEQILAGTPQNLAQNKDNVQSTTDFINDEYRLGIQVNSNQRSVEQGILYQTTHVRLQSDVGLSMPVIYDKQQLDKLVDVKEFCKKSHLVRLGGEGRMAELTIEETTEQQANTFNYLPTPPTQLTTNVNGKKRFMLYLISKLAMQENSWLPQGFNQSENGWVGKVRDIDITILSACIGKAYREGGWDLKRQRPRAITNFLPAGSAFFVEVDNAIDDKQLIDNLHGKSFLTDDEWGEGIILVGRYI